MPACVLYHGSASPPDDPDSPWRPVEELLSAGPVTASPAVLLVDASLLERLGDSRAVPDDVVVVATVSAMRPGAKVARRRGHASGNARNIGVIIRIPSEFDIHHTLDTS